jgi:hypothetical protein
MVSNNPIPVNLKPHLLLSALLLLPISAFADTIDLGTHGTLTIAVPKDWKLTSTKQDAGVDLAIAAPGGVNAQLLFSVIYVPHGATAVKADVDGKVIAEAAGFLSMSVEKKAVLRKYSMSGDAYGAYCLFTDASLVGKPPEKDNFKVVTVGIIWFNDSVGVSVSQVCDDEKGPEFSTMLAMTNSATLTNK